MLFNRIWTLDWGLDYLTLFNIWRIIYFNYIIQILPAFLACTKFSERFNLRNHTCFSNLFCELLNCFKDICFYSGSSNLISSFNLGKGVWLDICFICSRSCNYNKHCHCWGDSFQDMVSWMNCCWHGILSWNYNFRSHICNVSKVLSFLIQCFQAHWRYIYCPCLIVCLDSTSSSFCCKCH